MPKKGVWRAAKKLQLVHADICCSISPKSNSGKRYVTFIDDYIRKTWAYFLTQKSETLSRSKTYKLFTEKESGEMIGCLRANREGEFTSLKFSEFYNTQRIKR